MKLDLCGRSKQAFSFMYHAMEREPNPSSGTGRGRKRFADQMIFVVTHQDVVMASFRCQTYRRVSRPRNLLKAMSNPN